MHLDVVTIFPELFAPFRTTGLLGKAVERGLVEIDVHDLRAWAENKWSQVDDEPYGGGAGMVLQAPPVLRAVRALEAASSTPSLTILLTPRGAPFNQALAEELAARERLIVLCGRYEGFDERIVDILAPREVSLGDFILGGGEVAAMAVIEAVARLFPGSSATRRRWSMTPSRAACSTIPATPGRRSWKDIRCRRCYAPGTMRRFANGASSGRSKQR